MNYAQKRPRAELQLTTQGNNITTYIITQTGESVKHKPHRLPSAMANAGGGWDLERRLA